MDKVRLCTWIPKELDDKLREEAYETRKPKTKILVKRLLKSYEMEEKK